MIAPMQSPPLSQGRRERRMHTFSWLVLSPLDITLNDARGDANRVEVETVLLCRSALWDVEALEVGILGRAKGPVQVVDSADTCARDTKGEGCRADIGRGGIHYSRVTAS